MKMKEQCTDSFKPLKKRFEKAFPDRYDWQCPDCKRWNRYFEKSCPYCELEHRKVEKMVEEILSLECRDCFGTGMDEDLGKPCVKCEGEGFLIPQEVE